LNVDSDLSEFADDKKKKVYPRKTEKRTKRQKKMR